MVKLFVVALDPHCPHILPHVFSGHSVERNVNFRVVKKLIHGM